jgi:hypothetical protein
VLARPDFIILTAARIFGIALRPLILFVAANHGFTRFSDAFALFITAIAGSFVVFGNNAHIDLYRSTFNANKNILQTYLLTRKYVKNTISHALWFSPAGIALLYFWTQDIWISLAGLFVLYCEKIYDEFQRYYLYNQAYSRFTFGFMFRYAVPAAVVLIPLAAGERATLSLFIAASLGSFVAYMALLEQDKLQFYVKTYAASCRGGRVMRAYLLEYVRWFYANHVWSLVSANLFLLDRFMIKQSEASIGEYVFFANLFNLAVLAHTLVYFTYRRPNLIKEQTCLRLELLRTPNILPPALYCCGAVVVARVLVVHWPAYSNFSPILLIGLFIYFYLQAISLVFFDFVFWRTGRGKLAAADLSLATLSLGGYCLFVPPFWAIPFILSLTLVARILAYGLLYRCTGRFS